MDKVQAQLIVAPARLTLADRSCTLSATDAGFVDTLCAVTTSGYLLSVEDTQLVQALRRGDEQAFELLIERHHTSLIRLALLYVPDRAVAEDVAQETWLGVLNGIGKFEGRSSLKTWIVRILVNIARRRGQREARHVPVSSFENSEIENDEPTVDPARFLPANDRDMPNHWVSLPPPWQTVPEESALTAELRTVIESAIAALPPNQRQVITLRDLQGWNATEICNVLQITETNQRVLLHRARAKVRQALEGYFTGE